MKHLLRGLKRHGIGSRALSEDDFWQITEREGIFVHDSPSRFAYYYTVPKDDLRIISVPKQLSGIQWLFAAFHELGHHFLGGEHSPCVAFLGGSDQKCEAEADAVALIALWPKPVLDKSPMPIGCPLTKHLWDLRIRLFVNYGV